MKHADVIRVCLQRLGKNRVGMIKEHMKQGVKLLCGDENKACYFKIGNEHDIILLAATTKLYTKNEVTWTDLHQTIQDLYKMMTESLDYDMAIENVSQHTLKHLIENS